MNRRRDLVVDTVVDYRRAIDYAVCAVLSVLAGVLYVWLLPEASPGS
jgi:hypothetical protein